MEDPCDPKPGTDEAVALGCTCAVLNNCRGRGFVYGGKRGWWVARCCPVHDPDDALGAMMDKEKGP